MLKTPFQQPAFAFDPSEFEFCPYNREDPFDAKLESILRDSPSLAFLVEDESEPGNELRAQVKVDSNNLANTSVYHVIVDDGNSILESRLHIYPNSHYPAQRSIGAALRRLFSQRTIECLERILDGKRVDGEASLPAYRARPDKPASRFHTSVLISATNRDVAFELIEKIFKGLPDDIAGAKDTIESFVEGRGTPENVSPLERGLRLIEYRIFYNRENAPVGIGGLYQVPRFGESAYFLGWLGIAPEYRGKGYGRELIRSLEELATENGARELWVHTPLKIEEFATARNLYLSEGYKFTPAFFHYDIIYTGDVTSAPLEAVLVKDLRNWRDDSGRKLLFSLGWSRADMVQLQATWPCVGLKKKYQQ